MKGYLHSVETFGTVDGPGIRYVAFLQGCPLRCAYCHNPDSWQFNTNRQIEAGELVADVLRYRSFLGGLTLSGGEPLAQPAFTAEVLRLAKAEGLHTTIDTSGAIALDHCRKAVDMADLILLDIKHIDPDKCREITGQDNTKALALLEHCEKVGKPVWVRHVVVPGLSDDWDALERLAGYLSGFTCVERIEILPFHKMGEFKWQELGLPYRLGDVAPPDGRRMEQIRALFMRYGLKAA